MSRMYTLIFSCVVANILARRILPEYTHATLLLTGAVLTAYATYCCYIYPFYLSPFKDLPEPPGAKWPWGHAEVMRKVPTGEALKDWINSVPNDGLIRLRTLFNQECLFITNVDGLREVLVQRNYDWIKTTLTKQLLVNVIGDSLLVAEHDPHKLQRKLLMPAFSFRHIKDLYPIMWDKARQCTDGIAAATRDLKSKGLPPIQTVYPWASRTTLDIIGLAAVGYDFDSVRNPNGEAVSTYSELFGNEPPFFRWLVLGFTPPLGPVLKYPITPMLRYARSLVAKIKEIGYRNIRSKRAQLSEGKLSDVDLLAIAMESGGFTDEQLANQLMTFFAAGHETTSCALTWAAWFLCKHPEVQDRLRQEIRSSLPSISDQASCVQPQEIDRLPYLNAVANEVLRMMPPVPITMREAAVDTVINGRHIPKGTQVMFGIAAMNVCTKLWGDDASEFNPERWLTKGNANSGGAPSNFANLTFLHGPRSCIGKDFAKSELLILLAAWFGKFKLELADPNTEKDVKGWITVKPAHELPVVLTEVEGW